MKIIKYLSFVLLALVTASAHARWLSVDPVGFKESNPATFNRYAYANNNPYKYVDPDGREAVGAISFSYGLLPHSGMAPQSTVDTMTTGLAITTGLLSVPVGFGIVFPAVVEVAAAETVAGATIRGVLKQTTKETIKRQSSGRDGGQSEQIIERDASGNVISRTHKVETNGEVVHQHQNHIGKNGGERQFPDEWTGTKTINAPYENHPPQFRAKQ